VKLRVAAKIISFLALSSNYFSLNVQNVKKLESHVTFRLSLSPFPSLFYPISVSPSVYLILFLTRCITLSMITSFTSFYPFLFSLFVLLFPFPSISLSLCPPDLSCGSLHAARLIILNVIFIYLLLYLLRIC